VWTGFGLEIGFIDHVNTGLVTTLNYSTIANLHTLQITKAHAKSFEACSVFTSRSLVKASNNGDSSTKSSLHRLAYNSLTSKLFSVTTSRHGPSRKHRSSVVLQSFPWNMVVCEGALSNGCVYEYMPSSGYLLGYDAVQSVEGLPMCPRNTVPLTSCFTVLFCFAYSSTVKTGATYSS
jgi:hypothetical protein